MHLLITDSGLGGLSICAEAERALRATGGGSVRITYFNAWPEETSGYNDMPDIEARAAEFDQALRAMAAQSPDCIVIACNTLSIVYEHTAFRRSTTIPVVGIVETGVDQFVEALAASPDAAVVLLGTRTTIGSGVHRSRMIDRGIAPGRITAVSCHGLARAIEMDPDGETITNLIEHCSAAAAEAGPTGNRLFFGVCCTHYTYVSERMREALQRHCGRPVQTLDPKDRTAADVVRRAVAEGRDVAAEPAPPVSVTVLSKVSMDESRRRSIAGRVERISPATAAALLSYTRVPDLF